MVNLEIVALKVKCERQYQTIIKLQDEKIDLFKENQQLKEIIEELNEALNHIDDNIMETCEVYDVNGIELKKILDKVGDIDEKKN